MYSLQKVVPGISHYCASKAAVTSFTKSTALEMVEFGIRCNAVCPGGTNTPLQADVPEEQARKEREKIPMKKYAEPKGI